MKKIIFILSLLFSFITINAQVNLENGLIAYYPFNGNADDASGNGFHGDTYNVTLTEGKDGNSNSAYYFDTNNSVIKIPDDQDLRLASTDYTISAWVNVEEFSSPVSLAILSKRKFGSSNGYLFDIVGNNHPQGFTQGDVKFIVSQNLDPVVNANFSIVSERWFHLLVVYCFATERLNIYIDGDLKKEDFLYTPVGNSDGELWIGRDPINGADDLAFHGTIDEIRIYNRKLNIDEIGQLGTQVYTSDESLNNGFSKIKISPNPTSNSLFIQTNNTDITDLVLINLAGQKIYQGKFKNEIDINGLPTGIHFLQLKNKNGEIIKTEKVVIVNENRA